MREYEAGYRRSPEAADEIEAALATAVGLTVAPLTTRVRRIPTEERALRFALGLI